MCNGIYVKNYFGGHFISHTHFSANTVQKSGSISRVFFMLPATSQRQDISSHWETLQYFPLNQNLMVKRLPRDYALKTMEKFLQKHVRFLIHFILIT